MGDVDVKPINPRLFVVKEDLSHIVPGLSLDHHFHPEDLYYSRMEVNYQHGHKAPPMYQHRHQAPPRSPTA
ncbi:MAG: hypothetical protein QXT19_05100 [Candidatus Woesearchaeota archaeon]